MPKLLQIDFAYQGPFGKEMTAALSALAQSIADEPGLRWKIWTVNEQARRAGGIYLFSDEEKAGHYLVKHTERLEKLGITGIRAHLFDINGDLTKITRGPYE